MYCSKCGNELKEGENFCSKCGNNIENKKDDNNNENRQNEEKAKSRKRNIIVVIIVSIFLIPCLFFIGIAIGTNVTTTNKNPIKEAKSNVNSAGSSNSKKIEYGDSRYENSKYGEKVVRAYYNNYDYSSNVGKITSFTKSEFLEKDNYGRYAFKVTFKYNPKNKAGTATLTNMESTKTVIAIYVLNLDDPDGLYVGVQNVRTVSSNWEEVKKYNNLCGGAWNTPLTFKFTN